jgi:sRNA-binding carbon storage regulator CsrA
MLMLKRRSGQQVILFRDGVEIARIRVQDCVTGSAKLAFEAHPSVKILREELCRATAGSKSEPLERE